MSEVRDRIVARARGLALSVCARLGVPPDAACLIHAGAAVFAAQERDVQLMLQAGSASWRRLPLHLDDGAPTTHTHYGYEWQGLDAPMSVAAMATGVLPEMHAWAVDPLTREVVDITTGAQARRCELAGMRWLAAPPPLYLWGSLPDGAAYIAHKDACEYAHRMLTAAMRDATGAA